MSNLDWFNESLLVEPVSKYVQVQDKNIHYLVWGDENKPGIFFIHGYSAHAHWWDVVAPAFLDKFCAHKLDVAKRGYKISKNMIFFIFLRYKNLVEYIEGRPRRRYAHDLGFVIVNTKFYY